MVSLEPGVAVFAAAADSGMTTFGGGGDGCPHPRNWSRRPGDGGSAWCPRRRSLRRGRCCGSGCRWLPVVVPGWTALSLTVGRSVVSGGDGGGVGESPR